MNAHFLAGVLLEDEESGALVLAVLTPESQQELLRRVPPVHPEVKAHHMTIAFNPSLEAYYQVYSHRAGRPVKMKVVGMMQDDKAQAVAVYPDCDTENEHPHITISVATGVPAKYSNELLAKSGTYPLKPFMLEAVVTLEDLSASKA